MIFQHTINSVLTGRKTATTRIWKANYTWEDGIVFSRKTGNQLYYVGQRHALQPGRGKKGVATIEIERLSRVMIHNVVDDPAFIYREGFRTKADFLAVWREMHGTAHLALHIQFKLLDKLPLYK